MSKIGRSKREGFTIIEVVLVLAIAGLIFLMVFVALPSLQRSQRDTQRRNDLSRLGTALGQWQTNHGTSLNNLPKESSWTAIEVIPATGNGSCGSNDACELVRDYMNTSAQSSSGSVTNTFADPDGTLYNVTISKNISSNANPGNITVDQATLSWNGSRYTLGGNDPYSAHNVFIVPGGQCDEDEIVPSENRRYAIIYRLEGAGTYCLDDQ